MKKIIALAALSLIGFTGCSTTEVDLDPTAEEGKCIQTRTTKRVGIQISKREYIINC